jgi:hypothetical protein
MSPFEFVCAFYSFRLRCSYGVTGRSCFRLCISYGETGGVGVAQLMTQAQELDATHRGGFVFWRERASSSAAWQARNDGGFVLLANWRNGGKQVESAFIDDRRAHREDQISC